MNDLGINTPTALTPAEKMYEKHKQNVRKYSKRNPAMVKEKAKRYNDKLMNDPERHKAHLEKRRLYYSTILKPRKVELLEAIHEAKPTTLVI